MPKLDDEFFDRIYRQAKFSVFDSYHKEIYLWKNLFRNFDMHASWVCLIVALAILYSSDISNPRYNGRPRKLSILTEWLFVFELYDLIKIMPARAKVVPITATNRMDYQVDKKIYRIYRRIIRDYSSLKSNQYEQYVLIAKKYNWDYEIPDEVDNFYEQD